MKKILFMIHSLNCAGAQRVLVDMVNNLDLDEYDVTIHTIRRSDELVPEIDKRIHIKNIINTEHKIIKQFVSYLIRRVLPLKWVYNRFIKNDYDYEVAYLEGEVTRLLAYSTNSKAKKYAWVHTDMMRNFTSQGLYKTVNEHKAVYEKYDKIICVSEGVKKAFGDRFGITENVIVKYNISNEKTINKKAEESADDFCENRGINLITVSKLRPEKRHIMLLNVLKCLKNEGYTFFLHIVGDGSEYESVKQAIADNQLSDCVKLMGQKSNPYPYIKKSDLLVISSTAEGYPTVAVEAGVLGVPVISTECAGVNEVLNDGKFGIIVENSEEGLYSGLKEIFESPDILLKYKEILSNGSVFSSENRIKEINKLFED